MDKEILNEFAAEMLKLLQDGSQFIGEQAPIVCQEILRYNLRLSLLGTLVGIVWGAFGYWSFKKLLPGYAGWIEEPPYPHMAAGVCWIISLTALAYHVPNLFKVLLAPRLYLLDYFVSSVR